MFQDRISMLRRCSCGLSKNPTNSICLSSSGECCSLHILRPYLRSLRSIQKSLVWCSNALLDVNPTIYFTRCFKFVGILHISNIQYLSVTGTRIGRLWIVTAATTLVLADHSAEAKHHSPSWVTLIPFLRKSVRCPMVLLPCPREH